jgi:hypothetical protein
MRDVIAVANDRSLALSVGEYRFPTTDTVASFKFGAALVVAFELLGGKPPSVELRDMLRNEAFGPLGMLLNCKRRLLPAACLAGPLGWELLELVVARRLPCLMETIISHGPAYGLKFARGGETVLHLAARDGNRELVAMLVKAQKKGTIELDTNAEDPSGATALYLLSVSV